MISARKAAKRLGVAQDYIGKLCREGKLRGELIANAWHVSESSLIEFEAARIKARTERSEELSELRKQENKLFKKARGLPETNFSTSPAYSEPFLWLARYPFVKTVALAAGGLLLFSAVAFAGAAGYAQPSPDNQTLAAALAHIQSPFFAESSAPATGQPPSFENFFATVFAYLFGAHPAQLAQHTPPLTQTPVASQPTLATPVQTAAPKQTVIQNNTYPVTERTIIRTQSGITQADLDTQLAQLSNTLNQKIDTFIHTPPPVTTYLGNTFAPSTASTLTLTDADIPDNITASRYTPIAGYTQGDILYANASGVLTALGVGVNGQVLKVAGGVPSWGTDLSGGGGAGAWATTTDNLAIYPSDPTQVVIIGASATTTTGNILEVAGNSLFGGSVASYGAITAPRFVATTSVASAFPYASSTALTVSGTGYFSVASTTNLTLSSVASGNLLKTTTAGAIIAAVAGTDYLTAATTFSYPFPSNATTTQIAFNGGLTASNILATGSTTLQNFTAQNSTSTNATTTSLFASALGLGSGNYFTSFLGTGLVNTAGVLTVSTTSLGLLGSSSLSASAPLSYNAATGVFSISQAGTASNGYLSSTDFTTFNNKISSTSLSSANDFLTYNSSTGVFTASTSPTYTNATSTNFFANTLTLGSPLRIAYGGTGTSTAPAYGQLLVGNSLGGYDLLATSSLGITSGTNYSFLYPLINSANTISLAFGTTTANRWSALQQFDGGATTSALTITGTGSTTDLVVSSLGGSGTTCVQADATGKLSSAGAACGTGSGSVNSVSNSDGTLTVSPTTGAVVVALNLGHANIFSALQQFGGAASTTALSSYGPSYFGATATSSFSRTGVLNLAGITSSLLKTDSSNNVVAAVAGTDYIAGGAGAATTTLSTSGVLSFSANPVVFGSSPITLSISQAGTGASGYLSQADFNTFNNKISSTSLSATFPLAYNSVTGAFTFGGLSTSTAAVVGNIPYFSGANTFANVATGTVSSGTGISVTAGQSIIGSGLTITNTGVTSLSAGSGISLSGSTGAVTVSNAIGYPFPGNATTTQLAFNGGLTAAGATSTSLAVTGSSTISGVLNVGGIINALGALAITGTTTANNGFDISTGCYAIGGTCVNLSSFGGVLSVPNGGTGSSTLTGLLKGAGTGQVQTAVGGTDYEFPLTFNGPLTRTLNAISIPQAGLAANGYLSSTDFTTFNNKISSTSLSGASVISYNSSTGVITTAPGTFGGSGTYTFPGDLIVTGNASSTNLYASGTFSGAGLSACSGTSDKLLWNTATRQFTCGTDSGASGSDVNWTHFNGSGIRVTTASDQVLIGFTSTSTLSKLEVVGGTTIDNATTTNLYSTTIVAGSKVGIGTTSPTSALSVAGGNILHVASGNPALAATVAEGGAYHTYGTYVSGRYAYSADYEGGLRIIDISNPRLPTAVGSNNTYTGSPTARAVAVSGKYAYVADENTGLVIFDVSNPGAPVKVGSYAISGSTNAVAVSGKYVFINDFNNSATRIIDVSNPTAPALAGSFTSPSQEGPGAPLGLAVQGKYLYIADFAPAVYVVDISNPASPSLAGTYHNLTNITSPTALYVSGKYVYVADQDRGLISLNVSNPASPAFVSKYAAHFFGVQVAGNYAYLAEQNAAVGSFGSTTVIDISASTSPQLVGSYLNAGPPNNLFVSGKYAYVADKDQGLQVVNLNGLETPAANIGAIETNTANISDSLNVGGDIYAGGGLNVGISGIFSRGTIAAFVASTTQINPAVATFMGGNVGIGSTSPFALLSVNGHGFFGGNVTATNLTATGTLTSLNILATGSSTLQNFTALNATTSAATTTALAISGISSGNLLKTTTGGAVVAAVAGTDYATASTINSFKDWGIVNGYLTPTTTLGILVNASSTIGNGNQNGGLTVSGGATTTGNAYFAGNVGIGTPSAAAKLEVVSTTAGSAYPLRITTTHSPTGVNEELGIDFAQNSALLGRIAGNNFNGGANGYGFNFYTSNGLLNNSPALSILGNNNVGIGTTSSFANLSVMLGNDYTAHAAGTAFAIGSSTAGIATSTLFSVNSTGSTTLFQIPSSLLKTNSNGTIIAAVAGTDYLTSASGITSLSAGGVTTTGGAVTLATSSALSFNGLTLGQTIVDSSGTFTFSPTLSGTLGVGGGGTGQTSFTSGNLLYGAGSGALQSVATGTVSNGTGISVTAGQAIIGSGLTITNTGVTSNVAGTGISVSGATGAVTINFAAPASSALSIPFASTTAITATTASTTNLTISSIAAGNLLKTTTGGAVVAAVAGTDYATASTINSFQNWNIVNGYLTPTTTLGILVNASSTIGAGGQATGLTISGGATTTLNQYIGGRLGIGVQAPTQTLDVNGIANVNGTVGYFAIDGNRTLYASSTTHSVQVGFGAGNTTNVNAAYNSILGYNAGNNLTSGANNVLLGGYSTGSNSNLTSGSNNISIGYNISLPSATNNNQLDIQNILYGTGNSGSGSTVSTGQIGIASTSPWGRLSVDTSSLAAGVPSFAVGSSTRSDLVIDQAGNLGLGTASPTGSITFGQTSPTINLANTADNFLTIIGGKGTGGLKLAGASNVSGNGGSVYIFGGDIVSGTQGNVLLAFNATRQGNVGVGTSTPGSLLSVAAGASIGADYGVAAPTNGLIVEGNVGVGTSSPYKLFSVGGDAVVGAATAGGTLGNLYLPVVASQSCLGTDSSGKVQAGTCGSSLTGTTGQVAYFSGTNTAAGTSTLFISTASKVGVGTTSPFAQLTILPTATTIVRASQTTLGNNAGDAIYVAGRYAYIVVGGSGTNNFLIYDISTPASPTLVGQGSTVGFDGASISVQGKYAYIATGGATGGGAGGTGAYGLTIFDVSNPAAPVMVGNKALTSGGATTDGIYVAGRYAYVVEGGNQGSGTNLFSIFDVSNPSAPTLVGQNNLANGISTGFPNGGASIFVQGSYAYIAEGAGTTNAFEIFNISNPAAPTRVAQANLANGSASSGQPDSIYVQGRYAYIAEGKGTTNAFEIFDISNPAAPSRVSQSTLANGNGSGGGDSVFVQGRYAYIAEGSGTTNAFEVFDISNPAAPARIAQNNLANGANGSSGNGIHVQGRYAYIVEGGGTTNAFEIFDLGGEYVQQLEAGGLETGTLSVRTNLSALDGSFAGGLTTGGALIVNGSASITSATTTYNTTANIFNIATASSTTSILSVLGNGNVGIGTTNPISTFQVHGATNQNLVIRPSFRTASGMAIQLLNDAGSVNVPLDIDADAAQLALFGTPIIFNTGSSPAERMRIDNTGKVGIGTTSLSYKLDIDNSTAGTGEAFIRQSNASSQWLMGPTDGNTSKGWGLYSITDGAYRLAISGTTGNVGIGSSTPTNLLAVSGASNTTSTSLVNAVASITNTGSGNFTFGVNNSGGANANFGMYLDGTVKATIGYSRSGSALTLGNLAYSSADFQLFFNSDGSLQFKDPANGSAVRVTLSAAGAVTLSSGLTSSATGNYLCINTSTFEVTRGNGSTCTTSDARLKKNIQTLATSSGLDAVEALNPVTFNWRSASESTTTQIGFIAQDVQKIFPNLVYDNGTTTITNTDGSTTTVTHALSLNYNGFIPVVVKAVQELNGKVDDLLGTGATSTVTINAGTISISQPATTTIAAVDGAWSIATSTASGTVPIISISAGTTTSVSINAASVYINGHDIAALASSSATSTPAQIIAGPFAQASAALQNALTSALNALAGIAQSGVRELGLAVHASVGVFDKVFAQTIVVDDLTAQTITAQQKLCVGATCVTESQLQALLTQSPQGDALRSSGAVASTSTPPVSSSTGSGPSSDSASSTPPVTDTATSTPPDTSTNSTPPADTTPPAQASGDNAQATSPQS